jgi:hypothetical protein
MLRREWEFEYGGAELAEAAARQRDYRLGRVQFWTEAKAAVMAEIKESGIEVTESAAAGPEKMNYGNTRMIGPQISVRGDLSAKLTECHNKIQQHHAAAQEYNGWYEVMSQHHHRRYTLNHADWLYFFGKAEAQQTED